VLSLTGCRQSSFELQLTVVRGALAPETVDGITRLDILFSGADDAHAIRDLDPGLLAQDAARVVFHPKHGAVGELIVEVTGQAADGTPLAVGEARQILGSSGSTAMRVELAAAPAPAPDLAEPDLASDDLAPAADDLSVDAAPASRLALAPTSDKFGSVAVGDTSMTRTFTVVNTGAAPTGALGVSVTGANAGEFGIADDQCSGKAILPSQSCAVLLQFSPSAAGDRFAMLSVSGSPGGSVTATLQGTGLMAATLALQPGPSFDFGAVASLALSAEATFSVTNGGAVNSGNLLAALGGPDAGEFAISGDTCSGAPLAPTGACVVKVRFKPSAIATRAATLKLSAAPGGSASVALTGSGTTAAQLTLVSPTNVDFGPVVQTTTSADVPIVVTNSGGAATGAPVSVALSGPDAARFAVTQDCGSAAVAGGNSCIVKVSFTPNALASFAATVTIAASPGGQVQVPLGGVGVSAPALSITGATYSFGSVPTGGTSAAQSYDITNTGGVPTPSTVAAILTDTTSYSISSNGCVGVLAAGASCRVSVVFSPKAPTGAKTTTLRASAPGLQQQDQLLSGSGVNPSALGISPSPTFTYNTVTSDGTSYQDQTFTVTNNGGSTSGTISTGVSDATNFSILSSDNCNTHTLAPAASCTLTVRFKPQQNASGNFGTTLNVSENGNGLVDSLTGPAQAPPRLVWTPATWVFPPTQVNQDNGSPKVFTLTNPGDLAVSGLAVTVVGTDATSFKLTNNCTTTLTPGATGCTVTLQFHPKAVGTRSATLQAAASNATTATAALQGNGQWKLTVGLTGTGSGQVGGGAGAINCPIGACSLLVDDAATVQLSATADVSSTFASFSGGGCSTTPCTTAQIKADTTVNAQFDIKTFAVAIDKSTSIETATGTVSSADGKIACGATCSGTYSYNGSTTLTAAPDAGFAFQKWQGGSCDGSSAPVCAVNGITAAQTIKAVFTPINKVFFTSKIYGATGFGGVAGADTECQNLANAHALGSNFKAWISDANVNAKDRFAAATRGWVRVDGLPVADSQAALTGGVMFYPITVDETNTAATAGQLVWTGTNADGTKAAATCLNWTSSASTDSGEVGPDFCEGSRWTADAAKVCSLGTSPDTTPVHLYCFQDKYTAPISPPSFTGKRAFVSTGTYAVTSGLAAFDADCRAEAAAAALPNAATYVALVAVDGTHNAASRLADQNANWYRVDGIHLFSWANLDQGAIPAAPLNVGPSGVYNQRVDVWTGSLNTGAPSGSTCAGWTSTTGNTFTGRGEDLTHFFNFTNATVACNRTDRHLYCLEN
jgi:hypothetical protein